MMQVAYTKEELHKLIHETKREAPLVFVPTMGALHSGHLSLIDMGRSKKAEVIVSIFVNPKQFAAGEDFSSYPRNTSYDLSLLEEKGVEYVYLPRKEDIYPESFETTISVGPRGKLYEGIIRPHFFDGIALVVTKLLMQIRPDYVIFGEKDYQQLTLMRQLLRDLSIPTDVLAGTTIREADGLACSSRNAYLSEESRATAPMLYKTLCELSHKLRMNKPIKESIKWAKQQLMQHGFLRVDYVELVHPDTLQPLHSMHNEARILAAALLADVRLLDNIRA